MDILTAIEERHSVRQYKDMPIAEETRAELDQFVEQINAESGLCISIQYDEPKGFDSKMAHYGSFKNVSNYIVLAGDDSDDFNEKCGYYGEAIVLKAQMLGLNTCWAAMTFNKKAVKKLVPEGKHFCMVIALGYGQTPGNPHKGKTLENVVMTKGEMPDWFRLGAEAALLAPTAVNQQKFKMGMKNGEPVIKAAGLGFYTDVDLGIVKYHFEAASGRKVK